MHGEQNRYHFGPERYPHIVVSENNNDATVPYRLTLQCIAGICAPFDTPPTLSLTLTGCTTCRAGDQFIVQAHLTNAWLP